VAGADEPHTYTLRSVRHGRAPGLGGNSGHDWLLDAHEGRGKRGTKGRVRFVRCEVSAAEAGARAASDAQLLSDPDATTPLWKKCKVRVIGGYTVKVQGGC